MRRRSNLIILFGVAFFFVGAAIVFLLVNDDDGDEASSSSSAAAGERTVQVFRAAQDIPAGTPGEDVIDQGFLVADEIPVTEAPTNAITGPVQLQNQVFAIAVPADGIVTTGALTLQSVVNLPIPEGFEAVALQFDAIAGGARYVGVGDKVNIYGVITRCDVDAKGLDRTPNNVDSANNPTCPPDDTPRTDLILTNVLVLGIDSQDATAAPQATDDNTRISRTTTGNPVTVLVALKTTDVERAVWYTSFADMYLSIVPDDAPPAGETPGVDIGSATNPRSADSAAE